MDWLTKYRFVVGAFLVAGVIVLIGVAVSSDDDPEKVTADPPAATTDQISGAGEDLEFVSVNPFSNDNRPDVEPVDCRLLLTADEVKAALGRDSGLNVESDRETCTRSLLDDPGYFVTIEPGIPRQLGSGEPVPGVGDMATWSVTPSIGRLSVLSETPHGFLIFRIIVARPDADDATRFEAAKDLALAALPRFPGLAEEPEPEPEPQPEVITFERETVDRSGISYTDNLLAREEAGDRTRSEGLVTTLQMFVGEVDPAAVLATGDVLNKSATNLVALAQEYLDSGPDDSARSQIEQLLGEMLLSPEELAAITQQTETTASANPGDIDRLAATGRTDSGPPMNRLRGLAPAIVAQEGCGVSWYGLACADVVKGDGYTIYGPEEPAGGWDEDHIRWAKEAAEKTAAELGKLGELPDIMLVLSPRGLKAGEVVPEGGRIRPQRDLCRPRHARLWPGRIPTDNRRPNGDLVH